MRRMMRLVLVRPLVWLILTDARTKATNWISSITAPGNLINSCLTFCSHHVYLMVLGGNLHIAPIESPKVGVSHIVPVGSLLERSLTGKEDLGRWYRDRNVS